MLGSRLKDLKKTLEDFTGKDGEPKNSKESYILKSMWTMLCAEFEGSLKDAVEKHIDSIKNKKKVENMHICFLLQNCYGDKEEDLTIKKVIKLFKTKKSEINYSNFTKNKKPAYKSFHVEDLFNHLGIFFNSKEIEKLKLLDGIASTRDSISHGDYCISITRKQLENNIPIVKEIYVMLKKKLK